MGTCGDGGVFVDFSVSIYAYLRLFIFLYICIFVKSERIYIDILIMIIFYSFIYER